MAKKDPID